MSRRGGGGGGTAANGFQQGFDPDELFNMFFGTGFPANARWARLPRDPGPQPSRN